MQRPQHPVGRRVQHLLAWGDGRAHQVRRQLHAGVPEARPVSEADDDCYARCAGSARSTSATAACSRSMG